MNRNTVLMGAKRAFFAALVAGYAGKGGGIEKRKSKDGYTTITFVTGDFKVVDRYCTTPSSCASAGTTTIYFQNNPVWWMSYSGYYESKAIPFLKKVLAKTYKRRDFVGGRGQESFAADGMFYCNRVGVNEFYQFDGWEEIYEFTGSGRVLLGCHGYSGFSLI